jgi:hypothetical protein
VASRIIFRPWSWRRYVPPKRRLTLNGLDGVITQKMVLFRIIIVCTQLIRFYHHLTTSSVTIVLQITQLPLPSSLSPIRCSLIILQIR